MLLVIKGICSSWVGAPLIEHSVIQLHDNFNDSNEQVLNSDIGKKYKQAEHHWLRIDKQLNDTVMENPNLLKG